MKVRDLKKLLANYDDDLEIRIHDNSTFVTENLFGLGVQDNILFLLSNPKTIQHLKSLKMVLQDVQFNVDDTFSLYDEKTGDVLEFKNNKITLNYENKYDDDYTVYEIYDDPDFETAGGLIRFLQAFPKSTPINISIGDCRTGAIHEIRKENVCYLVGTMDDVDEECQEELFLEYGVRISEWCGGGTHTLHDNTPDPFTKEVQGVIAEPIKNYFSQDGKLNLQDTLTEDEARNWGIIIEEIVSNIYKYYNLHYRINGSLDSNGYTHPYDKNEFFTKPQTKESVD